MHPFQFALSTRAGTKCVAHVVQAVLDRAATILSLDGVGAYDTISRKAMMRGLSDMADGDKLLPFVRQFCATPSTFLWEDEMGETRKIQQGEGGEQGDPLMPLLFSVGQHRAMVAVQAELREGERLFAFLDDIYVVCPANRVGGHLQGRWSTSYARRQALASIWARRSCGTLKGENHRQRMHSQQLFGR